MFRLLAKDFKEAFLQMTPADEETLALHKKKFCARKKTYECAAYVLKCLDINGEWQSGLQCYQFLKENLAKKENKVETLLRDVIRVFVLYAASLSLKEVSDGNPDKALWAL